MNQIIAQYLAAEKWGNAPGRDKLLADNPELADELMAVFADHDRMHELAEPINGDNL